MRLIFLIILLCSTSFGQWTETDRQELVNKNMLKDRNPGGENGATKWSVTGGSLAVVSTTANVFTGNRSLSWDPSASSQVLSSAQAAYKQGLSGTNGAALCWVKTSATDIVMSVSDGSNTLVTYTVPSSTIFIPVTVNFVFSSGSITPTIRFTSASDSAVMYFDDCYLGPAFNISNVSQASLVGTAYIEATAACDALTRTSATLGAFTNDTGCPSPTVEFNPGPGTLQTTDADNAIFTVNSLPPGYYRVVMTSGFASTASAGNIITFAINDGTTTTGNTSLLTTGTSGAGSGVGISIAYFNYTTSGNRTYTLYQSSSAGTTTLYNEGFNSRITFSIERWPTSSETAFNAAQSPSSWSGYHVSTNCGGWTRTNTAYGDPAADADCDLTERTNTNFGTVTSYASGGSELPGIVFTPTKVQKYFICANIKMNSATAGAGVNARLWDGTTTIAEWGYDQPVNTYIVNTNLCGIYSATSVAAKTLSIQIKSSTGATVLTSNSSNASTIEWSIFAIDSQLPAPYLVNSVVNPSNGVEVIARAKLNISGASAGTITNQSGAFTAINVASTQATLTIASGTYSTAPTCSCSAENDTISVCDITDVTTTTAVEVGLVRASTEGARTGTINLICVGPK